MDKQVEKFNIEDGRLAERHVSVNENGDKVIDVFIEEKKPLKHEKRITEKRKEILAEQIIETIVDGQVIDKKVLSVEPDVKLQLREHLGVSEESELNALNYVSKKDFAQSIIYAVDKVLESKLGKSDIKAQSLIVTKAQQAEMALGQKVAEDKGKSNLINYILIGVVAIQVAALIGVVAFL